MGSNNDLLKKHLFIFLIICSGVLNAQTLLKGKVVNASTGEAISGVAIYLSGTSIGRVSGLDGTFELEYPDHINAPLIFRMIGYEKIIIDDPVNFDFSSVKLIEKPDALETVYIANDDWSRSKKEKYFKQYFLGTTPAADNCEIINLEQVKLRFNPVTHKLTAFSNESIYVRNDILGYMILCDLGDFEVQFEPLDLKSISISGNYEMPTHRPISSYIEVSTYFNEQANKKPSKRKRFKNRKRLYDISELKFYRDLKSGVLKKEGYKLLFNRKLVDIDQHIRIREVGNLYEVAFREKEYILMDSKNNQSGIFLGEKQKIVIDDYGNCLTPRAIIFNGFLSKLKVSGMLPLDYNKDAR